MEPMDKEEQALFENPFLREIRDRSVKLAQRNGHSWDYLEGALEHILMRTREKLSAVERIQFKASLAKYPREKLIELGDFTGRLSGVFSFLDEINKPKPAYLESAHESIGYYDQLPPPEDSKQIGRDTIAHVKKMLEFMGTNKSLQEKRRVEKEGLTELHKKYPAYGFDRVLREKRFG